MLLVAVAGQGCGSGREARRRRARPAPPPRAPPRPRRPSGWPRRQARLLASNPAQALAQARRALALTEEFEPTAFVTAGRKGEVVEDAFVAARAGYASHRALLYEAVGSALAARAAPAASRYFRRAFLLDASPARGWRWRARSSSSVAVARHWMRSAARRAASPSSTPPAQRSWRRPPMPPDCRVRRPRSTAAASRARQVGRAARRARSRFRPAPASRMLPSFASTTAPLTLLYAAEPSCRSCSADLEDLSRQVPKEVRVIALPPGEDQDAALRQVIALYRRPWPLLLGRDLAGRWASSRALRCSSPGVAGRWPSCARRSRTSCPRRSPRCCVPTSRRPCRGSSGTAGRLTVRRCRRSRACSPGVSRRERTNPSRRTSPPPPRLSVRDATSKPPSCRRRRGAGRRLAAASGGTARPRVVPCGRRTEGRGPPPALAHRRQPLRGSASTSSSRSWPEGAEPSPHVHSRSPSG